MQVMRLLLCLLIASSTIASGYTNLAIVNTLAVGDLHNSAALYTNLLLDNFTTQEASPIATPRSAEPGPGVWNAVQNDGSFSITNDTYVGENFVAGVALKASGQATASWSDLRLVSTNVLTRTPGLALVSKFRLMSGNSMAVGFERNISTGNPDGAVLNPDSLLMRCWCGGSAGPVNIQWAAYKQNADYETIIINRPSGAYFAVRGGASDIAASMYPDWTLLWVDNSFTNTTCLPVIDAYDGSNNVARLRVLQFGPEWTDPYYLASLRKETTADNDTATMPSDALVEHTITGQTNVDQELRVRVVDSSNKWIVRCGNTNNTVKIIELTGGLETERATFAKTWDNGTKFRLSVACYGSNITVYVDAVKFTTYASAIAHGTGTNIEVSHAGTNLIVWPMRVGNSVPGYAANVTKTFFAYGDSKTSGTGDEGPTPTGAAVGFPRFLSDSVNTNGTLDLIPLRWIGRGGYTVAQLAAVVDSDLAGVDGVADYVLLNVGANDCSTTIDSTFTNNYSALLSAFTNRWPNTKVYVANIWRTNCTGLASIQACASALVSARPTWCFSGLDETSFLGSNSADAIHPNHAGYIISAQKWREALGL